MNTFYGEINADNQIILGLHAFSHHLDCFNKCILPLMWMGFLTLTDLSFRCIATEQTKYIFCELELLNVEHQSFLKILLQTIILPDLKTTK